MKKTQNKPVPVMDERQKEITQKAVVFGFFFLILCLLSATIYRIVTTGDAGWELFSIIGSSVVILLARRILGDVEQPTDLMNRPLPTGNSKADRQCRCKTYALGSLIFGLTFGVMDILVIKFGTAGTEELALTEYLFPQLSSGMTLTVTAIIAFTSAFLISFIFDYLVGEYFKVRRYNNLMAQLDAEEEEE